MINLTRLWTGNEQPADNLRYGHGQCAPGSARTRRPIVVWNITRTCNLRCIHCYSDSMAQQYPGELTWEQMQNSEEDLTPKCWGWGDAAFPPVPMPSEKKFF